MWERGARYGHWVLVDGVDDAGMVRVRDPYHATRYTMEREVTSMVPGPDTVFSRSDQSSRLVVLSIDYEAETGRVTYRVESAASDSELVGTAFSDGGIRGIRMSESLEEFLRPYCEEDPAVVKRLVAATLRVIDGEPPEYPLAIWVAGKTHEVVLLLENRSLNNAVARCRSGAPPLRL